MSSSRAGKYDRKIELQTLVITRDPDSGEEIHTWTLLKRVWAQYLPFRQQERFSAGREVAVFSARFVIRYLTGIAEKDRIVFDGKNWDIIGISERTRRVDLEITAEVKE